jgi:hypothetical protein
MLWMLLQSQTAAMLKMGFAAVLVLALLVDVNYSCCNVIGPHKQQ